MNEKPYNLICGDALVEMKTLADNSVDSIVCDPPYFIGFMNKQFDTTKDNIAARVELWREALRVLKPGGHLLAFGASRTHHRLFVAIEDAGFEIRDTITWLFGSGFPKSLDVSKAVDKAKGQFVKGEISPNSRASGESPSGCYGAGVQQKTLPNPQTDEAKQWSGFGTALKPAAEYICLARKPLEKGLTVVQNVLKWGTGALNIDANRITRGGLFLRQNNQVHVKLPDDFGGKHYVLSCDFGDSYAEFLSIFQDCLARTFSALDSYNIGDTNLLHNSALPAGILDIQYQGATYGYDALQSRANEYAQKELKLPNFQGDYPTLSRFYDGRFHQSEVLAQDVVALSNDVQKYMRRFQDFSKNNLLSDSNLRRVFFLAYPYLTILHYIYCTVNTSDEQLTRKVGNNKREGWGMHGNDFTTKSANGRFPANVIHDGSDEVEAEFAKYGESKDHGGVSSGKFTNKSVFGGGEINTNYNDKGTASRFFYCAKASKSDRNDGCDDLELKQSGGMQGTFDQSLLTGSGNISPNIARNNHPTVKPVELMKYLCRLITPPNGTVLDMFCGSGSTGKAAMLENFKFIGIEQDMEYIEIAKARISESLEKQPLLASAA